MIKLVCWRKWSKIDLTTLLSNGQDAKITQFFKRILKYEVVWCQKIIVKATAGKISILLNIAERFWRWRQSKI